MDPPIDDHHDYVRIGKSRRTDQAEQDESESPLLQDPANTQELGKEHGHLIGNVDTSGAARVHLDDNHIANHYHAAPRPQTNIYEKLLDSLTFDRMDARVHNVLAALPMTCD